MTVHERITEVFANHAAITGALEAVFSEYDFDDGFYVDAFAIIERLQVVVLCSSSHDSRPVNRTFYFLSDRLISRVLKTIESQKSISAEDASNLTRVHDLDIAARITHSAHGSFWFLPIFKNRALIGFCRFASTSNAGNAEYFNRVVERVEQFVEETATEECDQTVAAHLLGRSFGERLKGLTAKRWGEAETTILKKFLEIPFGMCGRGFAMLFLRDFRDDTLSCIAALPSSAEEELRKIHDNIRSDKHMFTLVARCGQATSCADFPSSLADGSHKAYSGWKPDSLFKSLAKSIPSPIGYVGIPIRVDDNVIGVFQLLANFDEQHSKVREVYSFMRLVISELGRTLDKQRASNASQKILEQSLTPLPLSESRVEEVFAQRFFKALLAELWPHDEFEVYFVAIAASRIDKSKIVFPESELSKSEITELVQTALHSRRLILKELKSDPTRRKGVIAVPLFSHEAQTQGDIGCVIISGNIATLSSRSVTNVAQYLVTIGTAVWSENVARLLGQRILSSERKIRNQYDDLWSAVHDLKASLSGIYKKKSDLDFLLANRDLKGEALRIHLKRHTEEWFSSIGHVLKVMREASDRGKLRGIGKVRLQSLSIEALREAFTICRPYCECFVEGDALVTTSEYDLKRALTEVLLNSAQALEATRPRNAKLQLEIIERSTGHQPVVIKITDNAFRAGRFSEVTSALANTEKTLCKYVRTRCSRLLGIDIDASGDDKELSIVFKIPRELNPR